MNSLGKKKIIPLLIMLLHFWHPGFSNDTSKTALVLSGGGARGFAHIGVIRAFEEIGFYPDMVIGTSMGALIGGLYAAGNTSYEIENYIRHTKWNRLFSPQPYRDIEFVSQKIMALPELFALKFDEKFNVIFPGNLLPTQKLQERIFQVMVYPEYESEGNFDSLLIPFRAVASDIKTGKAVVLKKGSLGKTIAASSAFPIILAPVPIDSFLLVDGGITNNIPADVAVDMGADFIISVDVTSKITTISQNIDLVSYFNQAFNTLAYLTDTRNLYLSDILIYPEIEEYSSSDFDAIDSLIQRGYQSTQPFIADLRSKSDSSKWSPDFLPDAIERLNNTKIRSIKLRGNERTRPYIIKRELLLEEGDRWRSAYAQRSLKNLFSTGMFRTVYMTFENQTEDSTDIIIEVEEEENTLFSFGTRYDSERKASAFIAAKYRNLFGIGIDNQLSLIVSDLQRKLELNTRTTRIFTSTFTGYSSLYHKFESVPFFEKGKRTGYGNFYRSGFELNAGLQIRRVGLTAIGIKMENTQTFANSNYNITDDIINSAGLTARIIVENTDDPDIPRRGRINNVVYEHGFSEDELKQNDRILVESSVYETYNEIHTFSTHINFGYISRALTHYHRFRLGGLNSLPGYHQSELWGDVLLSLGIGYRTILTKGSYLHFLAVAGNVWNNFDDFKWTDMNIGARAGILVPTPIGPVSIDYGYNFKNRSLFYLSIGHFF
ncbi:MAG: patatin-like phospholipase family protein [Candidatus Marinimicrobia bacterium]|nr:patatin-like phospholipase family protein [Candidatus Neomarinimicrobiota bacterium]